jgi:hypothetical protein
LSRVPGTYNSNGNRPTAWKGTGRARANDAWTGNTYSHVLSRLSSVKTVFKTSHQSRMLRAHHSAVDEAASNDDGFMYCARMEVDRPTPLTCQPAVAQSSYQALERTRRASLCVLPASPPHCASRRQSTPAMSPSAGAGLSPRRPPPQPVAPGIDSPGTTPNFRNRKLSAPVSIRTQPPPPQLEENAGAARPELRRTVPFGDLQLATSAPATRIGRGTGTAPIVIPILTVRTKSPPLLDEGGSGGPEQLTGCLSVRAQRWAAEIISKSPPTPRVAIPISIWCQ